MSTGIPMPDEDAVRRAIEHASAPGGAGDTVPPIAPGKAPGGLVFQTWIAGELCLETLAPYAPPADTSERAEHDANQAAAALDAGLDVELRIHDGDTGRWIYTRRIVIPGL